jgi:hypothetical protein
MFGTAVIKPLSVQTQLKSIYYKELLVSTYLKSSSGSQVHKSKRKVYARKGHEGSEGE